MNSLFIESNRNIAEKVGDVRPEITPNGEVGTASKSKWNTIVSDAGIQLKQGDRISLESAMLNIPLIEDNVIQFLGAFEEVDELNKIRKDNEVELEIAYYTTNNIQNNFPLPSGKCSIEVNPAFQGNWGSPCFTGQNSWRTSNLDFAYFDLVYNTQGDIISGETPLQFFNDFSDNFIFYNSDGTSDKGLFRYISKFDSIFSSINQMKANQGGYFFSGADETNYQFETYTRGPAPHHTLTGPTPRHNTDYCKSLNDAAGFQAWTQQVPFYSMPGVQFGASIQPPAPVFQSPGSASAFAINPSHPFDFPKEPDEGYTTTTSTLNMNSNIGDGNYPKNTGSGFFSLQANGGANPLLLVQDYYVAKTQNATNIFNGAMPLNFIDVSTASGPLLRRDAMTYRSRFVPETPLYKGSYFNHNPNSRRLYHPRVDAPNFMNCGPYYDNLMNNLVEEYAPFTRTNIVYTYNGLVDFSHPRQHRSHKFFNLLTKKIKLSVPEGNLLPSKVAEILTENLNKTEQSEDSVFSQKIYTPPVKADRKDLIGGWAEKDFTTVDSTTCVTFPTIQGACYDAQQNVSLKDKINGWDAFDAGSISTATNVMNNGKSIGHNYKPEQAKFHFYSKMLCGNFEEWRGVTKILPLIQYSPVNRDEVVHPNFNYKAHSVYSGESAVNMTIDQNTQVMEDNIYQRISKPNPTTGQLPRIQIGNRGLNPTLFSGGVRIKASDKNTASIDGLGAILEGGSNGPYKSNATPQDPSLNEGRIFQDGDYSFMYRKYGKLQALGTEVKRFKELNYNQYDIIPTTIIFGGQVKMTDWEGFGNDIKFHAPYPGDINFFTKGDDFYNNTVVEWIIGRLNDQNTFPEQYINNVYNFGMNSQGVKGYAEYLPNVYYSNKLYNNRPDLGWMREGNSNNMNNIDNILQNTSKLPGSTPEDPQPCYRNSPFRMGLYNKSDNTQYTKLQNPNAFFSDGRGTASDYAYNFGLPTYSQFDVEYKEADGAISEDGFKRVCSRKIRAFNYLPRQNGEIRSNFTAEGLYYTPIKSQDITLDSEFYEFSTRPLEYTFEEYKEIYDEMAVCNDGKGLGIIPIFIVGASDGSVPHNLKKIPFCAVIYHSHDGIIPKPEEGEFFMMGTSPSLSQNDLHLPATTQQVNENEYKAGYNGIQGTYPANNAINQNKKVDFPDNETIEKLREANEPFNYAPSILTGAVNPKIEFDATSQRFKLTQFHTNKFKGSGPFQQTVPGGNSDSGLAVIEIGSKTASFSKQLTLPVGWIGYVPHSQSVGYMESSKANCINAQALITPNQVPEIQDQSYFADYQELIENNSIMDYYNPGGRTPTQGIDTYGSTTSPNLQILFQRNGDAETRFQDRCYGTSLSTPSTQFESRYLCVGHEVVNRVKFFNNKSPPTGNNITAVGPDTDVPPKSKLDPQPHEDPPLNIQTNTKDNIKKMNFERPIHQSARPFNAIIQSRTPFPTVSSQSGISIISMSVPNTDNTSTFLLPENYELFDGTLLNKCGFILNQILPLAGKNFNELINSNFNELILPTTNANLMNDNVVKPITTNGQITSAISNSLVSGFSSIPGTSAPPLTSPVNFNIPMQKNKMIIAPGSTESISDSISAKNPPSKSEFPYLTCRSSIQTPSGLQYIGGKNGKQLLPVISYLMTNYNSKDYSYITRSDLVFVVNRSYTLTDITTSIHLPNGRLAENVLGENSAVIYKIDFVERTEEEQKKIDEALDKYFKKG